MSSLNIKTRVHLYIAFSILSMNVYSQNNYNIHLVGYIYGNNSTSPNYTLEDIDVFNNYAYISALQGGIRIIDVSDIAAPIEVDTTSFPAFSFTIAGEKGYSVYDKTFSVLDLPSPDQINVISDLPLLQTDYWVQGIDVEISGSIAVVGTHNVLEMNGGIEIIDISNSNNPSVLGNMDNLPGLTTDIAIKGDYVYISAGLVGAGYFYCIDISDPAIPSIASFISWNWDFASGFDIVGDTAYISTVGGIHFCDISNPQNISNIGLYEINPGGIGNKINHVQVLNDYAYLIYADSNLVVLDIEDLQHITEKGVYKTEGECENLYLNNGNIFVSGRGHAGIYKFDISTGVSEITQSLTDLAFKPNTPNPFSFNTVIRYQLNKEANVHLVIYDQVGRQIKELVRQRKTPGDYQIIWDGKNTNGQTVPNGIYYCVIHGAEANQSQKIVFLK